MEQMDKKVVVTVAGMYNSFVQRLKADGHKDVKVYRSWKRDTNFEKTSSESAGIFAELRTNRDTGDAEVLWERKGFPQQLIKDVESFESALESFSA